MPSSCLTLRTNKGIALTHAELDNNFVCLDNNINTILGLVQSGIFLPITGGTLTGPLSVCNDGFSVNEIFSCVPSGITVNSPLTIYGNVTIWGSATTLNTEIIQALDNSIYLNYSGDPSTADGGGIVMVDGQGVGITSSITVDSDGCWTVDPGFCNLTMSGNTNVYGTFYINGLPINFDDQYSQNVLVTATGVNNYTGTSTPSITAYTADAVYFVTFENENNTS